MAAITRLGLWGHNTRRAGSFAGKALAAAVEPISYLTLADWHVTLARLANAAVTSAGLADAVVTGVTIRNAKP